MFVTICGDNETADLARHLIANGGGRVVDGGALFSFDVRESGALPEPIVDGVDSEFERRFVTLLAEISPIGRVLLKRQGGNQDDRVLVVTVPATEYERRACALAIYRTIAQLDDPKRLTTWQRVRRAVAAFVFVLVAVSHASGQVVGGTVDQGAAGAQSWLVNCTTGCSTSTDGTATASLTSVTCPGSGCVDLTFTTASGGSGAIQVSGTWVASVTFSVSVNGTDFTSLYLRPYGSSLPVAATTANGIWSFGAAGFKTIRVALTSYTSGSVVVTMRGSSGSQVVESVGLPASGETLAATFPEQQVHTIHLTNISGAQTDGTQKTQLTTGVTETQSGTISSLNGTVNFSPYGASCDLGAYGTYTSVTLAFSQTFSLPGPTATAIDVIRLSTGTRKQSEALVNNSDDNIWRFNANPNITNYITVTATAYGSGTVNLIMTCNAYGGESMTNAKIDALPLPSGAATAANQATEIASLASIDGKLRAATVATATVTVVDAAMRETTLLNSNSNRLAAIIQNTSKRILLIKFGTGIGSANFSVMILPRSSYQLPSGPTYTGVVTGIWTGPEGGALITEF